MSKTESYLCKNKRKAERQRLLRSQESQETREQRLEKDRIRHSVSRALESDARREKRLIKDRIRTAASRNRESDVHRQRRLNRDRIRHAVVRSLESEDERDDRLENDRIGHAVQRLLETTASRQRRLEKDLIRHAFLRMKRQKVKRKNSRIAYNQEGEKMNKPGIDVTKGCFIRWQLYMSCSYSRARDATKHLTPENHRKVKRKNSVIAYNQEGEKMNKPGIDVTKGCFIRWQLYMSCSYSRARNATKHLTPENHTPNIV